MRIFGDWRAAPRRAESTGRTRGRIHGDRAAGQALVEFALVFPILILVLGAIIQFGLLFWSQATLTQVVRDTGRWASTQGCDDEAAVIATANAIASQSSMFGYTPGSWTSSNVSVDWEGEPCPPDDNSTAAFVTIEIDHTIPIFFTWIPGSGAISSSVQFRMEPSA